jgi:hypothetical protein
MEYFLRNPKAADDLLGIASYRLPEQVIYQHVTEVSDALDWLVSVGWLHKTTAASSSPTFSLNAASLPEVEMFVAGRPSRADVKSSGKRPAR